MEHAALTTASKIAKARASDRLSHALVDLDAQGLSGWLWISEDPEDRAQAIKICAGCPIIKVCGDVASRRREPWGVWGGRDRSRNTGKVGRPRKTAAVIEPDDDEAA
jgi:hypothetical protein